MDLDELKVAKRRIAKLTTEVSAIVAMRDARNILEGMDEAAITMKSKDDQVTLPHPWAKPVLQMIKVAVEGLHETAENKLEALDLGKVLTDVTDEGEEEGNRLCD